MSRGAPLASLPETVVERLCAHLSTRDVANLERTHPAVRASVRDAGWGRAQYRDAYVHCARLPQNSPQWREACVRRAEVRLAAGRAPGGQSLSDRDIKKYIAAGLDELALVLMQPLAPAALRGPVQTERLATALTHLGRADEAQQARDQAAPREQLLAALDAGDVAGVRASLAAGAGLYMHDASQIAACVGRAAGHIDTAPEAWAEALALWQATLEACRMNERGTLRSDPYAALEVRSNLAEVRFLLSGLVDNRNPLPSGAGQVIGTSLLANLAPQAFADGFLRREFCALLRQTGRAMSLDVYAELLRRLHEGNEGPLPAAEVLAGLADDRTLPFGHLRCALSHTAAGVERSLHAIGALRLMDHTAENLAELRAAHVDLAVRTPCHPDCVILLRFAWDRPELQGLLRNVHQALAAEGIFPSGSQGTGARSSM